MLDSIRDSNEQKTELSVEDLSSWWCDIASLALSGSSIRMETNYWANQIWSFATCV